MHKRLKLSILIIFASISITQAQHSKKDAQLLVSRMYYFTQNLTWPAHQEKTFNIAFPKNEKEVKFQLERLAARKAIGGKKIKLIPYSTLKEVATQEIHILHLNNYFTRRIGLAASLTSSMSCLLISEDSGEKKNVMINMIVKKEMNFEINKSNLSARNIKVGANLLLIGGKEVDVRELYIESAKMLRSEKEKVETQKKHMAKQTVELKKQTKQITNQKVELQEQTNKLTAQSADIQKQVQLLLYQRAELDELLVATQQQEVNFQLKQTQLQEKEKEIAKQEELVKRNNAILEGLRGDVETHQSMIRSQKSDLKLKDKVIYSSKLQFYIAIALLALFGIVIFIAIKAYFGKKKANQLLQDKNNTIKAQSAEIHQRSEEVLAQSEELAKQNAEIQQQKEEIESQKEELQRQNDLVNNQNNMITGSIRYAQTIQSAILPPQKILDNSFDNFVLFSPKDIVSGDFYWHARTYENDIARDYFAVVDCTGHGVPGAFMSMIGSRVLNLLVNERMITDPAQILDGMDTAVQKSLRQDQTDNRDGMEVCLVKISHEKDGRSSVEFSGARRPLFVYQHKTKEIIKFVGNVRGIAGPLKKSKKIAFATAKINMEKGDVMYLTSDGYKDQSDHSRKRFGSPSMMRLMQSIGHLPTGEQMKVAHEVMQDHMKGTEQRDDITFAGIRI